METDVVKTTKPTIYDHVTPISIVTDSYQLSKPVESKPMNDVEIAEVTSILTEQLSIHGGLGLSSNQLGLDARACIINVKEPLVLINPVITKKSTNTIIYGEQCLSIPKSMKKINRTVRFKTVTVHCDNLGIVEFSPDLDNWKDREEYFNDMGLLETVCIQHEIDHLDGILMTDKIRKFTTTVVNGKNYGRNEKVMVQLASGITEFMKYKHAESLQKSGVQLEIL